MKKFIAALSIAAVVLSLAVSPVLAKEGRGNGKEKDEDRGLKLGRILREFRNDDNERHDVASNKFLLVGTVSAVTASTLSVNVKGSVHVPNLTNNVAQIMANTATKVYGEKNKALIWNDIKVGQQVLVSGSNANSTLTAEHIKILAVKGKAYGEVTAKTDTSITIKNSVTGATQTFTTDSNTQVNVNGEAKTMTDVQVGDKGFVKFKNQVSGMFAKVVNLFR